MKSLMASFSLWSVRTVFVNYTFHCSPHIIIKGVQWGNCGDKMSYEIILSPNTSHSSIMETQAVCAVAPSCEK
jgi:hypothetical protein